MGQKSPEEIFYEGLTDARVDDLPTVYEPVDDEYEPTEEELEDASQPDDDDPVEEKTARQVMRPVTRNNLFSHPEAHPFVLDMALIKAFKLDWFAWDPDALFQEIRRVFKTSVADINRVKIMAVVTLHVIDSFWDRWEIFEKVVLALNGIHTRPHHMQPPDLPSLMAGVDIANSIRKEDFDEEVARYTAACLLNEEVTYAPDPLDFCQPYLSNPRYKCQHCGKHGSALPPFDGRCDSCSQKFQDDHPFNFKPAEGAKDKSKDVSYYLELDPEPTKKRFEELIKLPPEKLSIREVPEDIESAKLIAATDYTDFRKKQRDRQLSEIKDWMIDA
jgi:hypothetical protein